jgi:hypothetical protein
MIDLNNGYDSSIVFNDGVAGIVEGVSLRAESKKEDDKENAPNLKVIFVDSKGGEVNFGLWNIKATSEDPDKDLTNLGRTAKHIFHTIFGSTYVIPPFKDDVELIAGLKRAIDANPTLRYRVVVNYGTESYPSDYLRVKKFVPFMENAAVKKEDSKLSMGKSDLLKKVVADDAPMGASTAPTKSWVAESAPEEPVF